MIKNLMPVEAIIFDCDGVLIDSEVLSARILTRALSAEGIEIDFDHFCVHFLGRSFPNVAAEIRRTFAVDLPQGFEAAYRADLLRVFETALRRTPGIRAVLRTLGQPYCVATSSSPERVSRSLALTGLDAFFGERVYTASQVARGKPAPDLFLHAAQQINADPQRCLVIEDSLPGIAAARAAGMLVLRYTGGAHLRGRYLKHDPSVQSFDNWADLPLWMAEFA